jgi:NAD(P)-dependent dehydrogenase (short-subunit alcohol dehydrogenase family)
MGKLDGKVALIAGAARSQGRCHAALFTEDGRYVTGITLSVDAGLVAR